LTPMISSKLASVGVNIGSTKRDIFFFKCLETDGN
jgi:hypothetical protein